MLTCSKIKHIIVFIYKSPKAKNFTIFLLTLNSLFSLKFQNPNAASPGVSSVSLVCPPSPPPLPLSLYLRVSISVLCPFSVLVNLGSSLFLLSRGQNSRSASSTPIHSLLNSRFPFNSLDPFLRSS